MGLVENVADRYLARGLRTAALTVEERGSELIVSGSYQEMKDVFPKLKSRGFYYNGSDRTWRIPLSKLTPRKRKNLDKLLGKGAPGAVDSRALQAERDKVLRGLLAGKYLGFGVNQKGLGLLVRGTTYPIMSDLKRLGGRWMASEGSFFFGVDEMKPGDVSKLQDVLEARSKVLSPGFQ